MTQSISPVLLAQLSDVIAAQMGLHFPRARWHDLERGIRAAARELDFRDVAACIQWLLSSSLTQHQIAILAGHLTIGETYFFREPPVFAMLEEEILPAQMRTRRERTRRLRIRSAGCTTGEEPYSIAISISKVIPDMQDWDITLLATDINPRFQQQASEGVYREWSFRDTPPWITARYFSRQPGGRLAILPAIQQMVKFAYLNLVDDELCAHNQASAQALALFARACANQGQLTEARQWCEQAIAADRLDARLHFLLATILQEQDALDDAVLALKRALYLDQHFVLAHLTLGTLELRQGKCKAAAKHFETVLALLSAYRPHEVLPESDGMTAARLREIIASMYQQHTTQ